MSKKVNLILSGGFGTRLWPLSMPDKPKQFLPIFNGKSLFQHTIDRNLDLVDEYFIVTNAKQWNMAEPQFSSCTNKKVHKFLEPCPRNTAPAIAAACMRLDREDLVLVSPSDHMISGEEYAKAVSEAFEFAKDGYLVTFGLNPTEPHTGYGYIESEGNEVKAFHEKPDLERAKRYVDSGNFYWNSGMFAFKAGVFLDALKEHSFDIFDALSNVMEVSDTLSEEQFMSVPEDSIDYAVMEKSSNIRVVPGYFKWYDLGSYEALFSFWEENKQLQPEEYQELGENRAYSKDIVRFESKTPTLLISDNGITVSINKGDGQKVKSLFKSFYS